MIARAVLEKVVQLSRTPRKMHARKNVKGKKREINRQSCDEMVTYCKSRRTEPVPSSPHACY